MTGWLRNSGGSQEDTDGEPSEVRASGSLRESAHIRNSFHGFVLEDVGS